MKEKNAKKNFIWNSIGLTLNSFNSLFFLIVVKLINGIDIAGIFTYAFSICCLFYFLAIYYNRIYQVSDYEKKFTFNQYFTVRILTSIVSVLILLIFSILNGFSYYKSIVIVLLMIFKSIEAISDCLYGQIQKDGNLYKVGISYSVKAIIGLSMFILVDFFTKNLILAIVALIMINIITLLTYDYKSMRSLFKQKIKFDNSKIKLLLKLSFPIFIFSFLQNYLSTNQKYIMTYFLDNKFQTIFGILIMPATILNLVGTYLILPYVNTLTDLHNKGKNKEFNNNVVKICLCLSIFGLFALIGTFFIGIPFLNIVYNIKLDKYKNLLLIIILAAIFNALTMIISSVLTIIKINKQQIVMFLISSVISTVLSIILIGKYKISGAVYSYLISYIIALLIFAYNYKKYIKVVNVHENINNNS